MTLLNDVQNRSLKSFGIETIDLLQYEWKAGHIQGNGDSNSAPNNTNQSFVRTLMTLGQ